jgi:hypothetical protein
MSIVRWRGRSMEHPDPLERARSSHFSLNWLPPLGSCIPRSGLSRSDFVPWHDFTGWVGGRARQLCPGTSDVDLLCDVKGVVDLNAKIPHRAFDPPVAEK